MFLGLLFVDSNGLYFQDVHIAQPCCEFRRTGLDDDSIGSLANRMAEDIRFTRQHPVLPELLLREMQESMEGVDDCEPTLFDYCYYRERDRGRQSFNSIGTTTDNYGPLTGCSQLTGTMETLLYLQHSNEEERPDKTWFTEGSALCLDLQMTGLDMFGRVADTL